MDLTKLSFKNQCMVQWINILLFLSPELLTEKRMIKRVILQQVQQEAEDVQAIPASDRSLRELLRALLFRPSPMA